MSDYLLLVAKDVYKNQVISKLLMFSLYPRVVLIDELEVFYKGFYSVEFTVADVLRIEILILDLLDLVFEIGNCPAAIKEGGKVGMDDVEKAK